VLSEDVFATLLVQDGTLHRGDVVLCSSSVDEVADADVPCPAASEPDLSANQGRNAMKHEEPMYLRLYFDELYADVAQLIGYAGCVSRDLWDRLQPAVEKFGKGKVERATTQLLPAAPSP
jgi:hypothetical protein